MLTQVMMNRAFLPAARTTRRGFLIGATAVAGGFAVGFRPVGALAQEAPPRPTAINPFAAYVTITADDRVTVISSQFDMGQGSYHGIATLVLEELGAPLGPDRRGRRRRATRSSTATSPSAAPFQLHRRLDLDGLVLGPLPPGRRDGARDAGRRGGRAVGRAGGRDHGRRRAG